MVNFKLNYDYYGLKTYMKLRPRGRPRGYGAPTPLLQKYKESFLCDVNKVQVSSSESVLGCRPGRPGAIEQKFCFPILYRSCCIAFDKLLLF